MRTSHTVGFAVEDADAPRLAHLTEVFGGGNRSAFLRRAMDVMERYEQAQRLGSLQAYGETRLAETGRTLEEIPDIVAKVLADPDPEAVAQAKLIVAGLRNRRRIERPDGAPLSPAAAAVVQRSANPAE
jgi:hypothetical protein